MQSPEAGLGPDMDGARVKSRKFVIFAGSFDENIGGVIALHRLCDLLNREGQDAYLWPELRPALDFAHPFQCGRRLLSHYRRGQHTRYKTCPGFQTPLARQRDLLGAIVVYPEVIAGNPLHARRVVRWLLHKPGFHTGVVNFGPHDRFFFYQNAFNDSTMNPHDDNLLKTVFVRDDVYRHVNFGERHGTCYIMRKGKGRPIVHDLADSVLVDDLSHTELAEVFNRVHTCISYDTYTMYSVFAALCGCLSVVVPEEGVSKAKWYPEPSDRYGMAYGFEDVEHALRTRHLVLPHLKVQESEANATVRSFVEKCAGYFPV